MAYSVTASRANLLTAAVSSQHVGTAETKRSVVKDFLGNLFFPTTLAKQRRRTKTQGTRQQQNFPKQKLYPNTTYDYCTGMAATMGNNAKGTQRKLRKTRTLQKENS